MSDYVRGDMEFKEFPPNDCALQALLWASKNPNIHVLQRDYREKTPAEQKEEFKKLFERQEKRAGRKLTDFERYSWKCLLLGDYPEGETL